MRFYALETVRVVHTLIGIVLVEALILVVNGWRCPLTDVAARYTTDRADNFDIYLPLLLARYNKLIFGSLLSARSPMPLWVGFASNTATASAGW